MTTIRIKQQALLLTFLAMKALIASMQLRARGWVNSLSAGGGMSGSGYKDFNLNIQLTEAGVVHALQVAQAVFNYIQLIASSGLEAWRYEEKRLTSELSFHFQETPAGELALNCLLMRTTIPSTMSFTETTAWMDCRLLELNKHCL